MKKSVIVLMFFCSKVVFGQSLNDFEILRSSGAVPDEFNTLSSEKVTEKLKTVSKKQVYKDRKSEEQFILESNFLIDNLLASGGILYNEELSEYVSKVADEVLKNDKELRSELRFYILKTPTVNAFTTDRGTIFVTVGLLAQIQNEAQLAFILSHEIIHYKKQHAKTGFVENQKIEEARGKYKRERWDKAFNKSKYSKELEMEADIDGYEIYSKTNYSLTEISSAFDVLQYSYLPIDDVKFDRDYFDSKNFKLPQEFFKDELDEIESNSNDDDDYATHPNINKRRAIIDDEINGASNAGRLDFIYSEDEFHKIQALAQFEISFLYTKNLKYGESIYNDYLLLKKYPKNKFLRTNMAYNLYALAKYKNENKIHKVLTDYSDVEGQSQQIFYLFDKIDKKTLNTIAVKYLWELKQDFKEDNFINTIAENALRELLLESGVRKSDYKKEYLKVTTDTINDGKKLLGKYAKIKSKKEGVDDHITYAFVNLFKDEEFSSLMKKYEKEYVRKAKEGEDDYDSRYLDKKNPESDVYKEKKGRTLGIDKIVMVSPNYKKFDLRKKVAQRHKYSESKNEEFIEINKLCADKGGVDLTIISNTYFETTERYNDMSLLNDWMDERFEHKNIKIYPYCRMYTDELVTKYGTSYFGWTGLYGLRNKKDKQWLYYLAAGVVTYGLTVPVAIYKGLTPENHMFYYTYLVDITNYDFLMAKEDYVQMKDYKDVMKSYVYDSYNQIKTKKK